MDEGLAVLVANSPHASPTMAPDYRVGLWRLSPRPGEKIQRKMAEFSLSLRRATDRFVATTAVRTEDGEPRQGDIMMPREPDA